MKNGDPGLAHETLMSLLFHPTGLDEAWLDGRTLLAEAVRWNCAEIVSALLEHGADADAPCSSGLRPLHLAAMSGRLDLVHQLVVWGADPSVQDNGGLTPLGKAILTAPAGVLHDVRELLLVAGAQESPTERTHLEARLLADRSDKAYLARFRGDGAAPPAGGVAAHIG